MTQKEIDKFLANTKVYVNGKSKEIQEKLFSLGYKRNEGYTDVIFTECPFLYIDNNHYISYRSDMCVFIECGYREITAEEILSLKLTESAYRPFKNKEECWNEIHKHHPILWVLEVDAAFMPIDKISNLGIHVNNYTYFYKEAFKILNFSDGTPFGIKEE